MREPRQADQLRSAAANDELDSLIGCERRRHDARRVEELAPSAGHERGPGEAQHPPDKLPRPNSIEANRTS